MYPLFLAYEHASEEMVRQCAKSRRESFVDWIMPFLFDTDISASILDRYSVKAVKAVKPAAV